jgi:hypothetical protein
MAFVRYTGKSISLLETVKVVCNEKKQGGLEGHQLIVLSMDLTI